MTSHQRSYGTLTTVPPSRAIASSFVCGAFSGAMIVAGTPSSRAAQATPCAMLPALAVTTPLAVAACGACRIALTAPRILNEPIGCRFSSLSQISAGPSTGEAQERRADRGAGDRLAARARSPRTGSRTRPRRRRPARGPSRTISSAAARSSTARPERLEDGQLGCVRAARVGADQHLAELGADVLLAEAGQQQVARLVHRRLAPVDEEAGRRHRLGVELAGRRHARADGVDVRARPRATLAAGSARGRSCRCRPRRPRAAPPRACRRRRGSRCGSRRPPGRHASPPCASGPGRRRRGSRRPARRGRASARVATAETAAVRISVIGEAFRSARSSPVSPSWSSTAPWCASSPRAGFPGAITISFSDQTEPSPPRCAGMKPIRLSASGGRVRNRSGWWSSPRASERRTPSIASMHSSIGSSARTSCSERTSTLM